MSPSAYPAALDVAATFPQDITDDTDSKAGTPRTGTVGFLAQLLRDLGDAVVEIETELGTNPSGSFVDVLARLNGTTTVRKTADQAFTTQTLANVTDLAFPIAANTDYSFRFLLHDNGGTARGVGYGLTISGTNTRITGRVVLGGLAAAGSDSETVGAITATAGSVTSAARTSTGNFISIVEGIVQQGAAAGTLQLQARQGTGATAANMNVLKGSHGILWAN